MDYVALLGELASMTKVALELWVYKDKKKYETRLNRIELLLERENRKPVKDQDFALLDSLDNRLRVLSRSIRKIMAAA